MKKKPAALIASVDRIEGPKVVLEGDDGRRFTIPVAELTDRPREGLLYRVPLDPRGEPLWSQAQVDAVATDRRRKELADRMNRLRGRDDGGDTKL